MGSINVFRVFGAATCLAAFLATPATQAGPTFSIGDGTSTTWTQAINSGLVAPSTTISTAETAYYTQAVGAGNFAYASPVLTPDVALSDGTTSQQALVMSWNPPPNTPLGTVLVSGWQYTYGSDPDLTNSVINLSVLPPKGVYNISVELFDSNGNEKSYFMDDPANNWAQYSINPAMGNQSGFRSQTTGNFDITHVTKIKFDEGVAYSSQFPLDPTGNGLAWNGWGSVSVSVVPEPSSLTLTGLATLMSFGFVRFRRKRVA